MPVLARRKDVVVIIFVVVVQDGLPSRGRVLPARAGECYTGITGHVQLVAVASDAYRLPVTRSLLQTSDGDVRTDTM